MPGGRTGPCPAAATLGGRALGPVIAGDGRAVARWRLRGDRGELEHELVIVPDGGETLGAVTSMPRLGAVTIVPRSMVPPDVES
jgi:hypothetical protein